MPLKNLYSMLTFTFLTVCFMYLIENLSFNISDYEREDIMKKKILISLCLTIFLTTGLAAAATDWGKFEGFNIIRLFINGKEAKVQDVPAVNLNGRTMVPIYMLREAGLNVSWNGTTSTVSVTSNTDTVKIDELKKQVYIMDYYNTLVSIGDSLTDNASALSTATTGIVRYNNREALDAAYTYLDNRIEHYNYAVDIFNNSSVFNNTDIYTITEILNTYYDSIESHKLVLEYLEKLYITPDSEFYYNNIYDELVSSDSDRVNARTLAMTKYYDYRNKIL